jgi:hypothetical protein
MSELTPRVGSLIFMDAHGHYMEGLIMCKYTVYDYGMGYYPPVDIYVVLWIDHYGLDPFIYCDTVEYIHKYSRVVIW